MNQQQHTGEPAKRSPDDTRQAKHKEEAHPKDAKAKAEQASRSVMHPESFDPEWRYYHGAWGG